MRTTFTSRTFITRATLIAGLGLATTGPFEPHSIALAEDFACRADLDGDQVVTGADFGRLLTCWGECAEADCTADIDGSGCVDGGDLGLMLMSWGPVPDHCVGPTPSEPFHMPTMTDTSTLDVVVVEANEKAVPGLARAFSAKAKIAGALAAPRSPAHVVPNMLLRQAMSKVR